MTVIAFPGHYRRDWSDYQLAIFEDVLYGKGPLQVRARAGSGKTSVIAEAVQRLYGVGRPSVLVCAYNKRIQVELERRVPKQAVVKTLHAFGLQTIKQHWGSSGTSWSSSGGVTTVKYDDRAKRILRLRLGKPPTNDLLKTYNMCKAKLEISPEKVLPALAKTILPYGVNLTKAVEGVVRALGRSLVYDGEVDYADQIFVPVAGGFQSEQFDYVFIDEAQDMNFAQLVLATGAVKPDGRLIVVGDDRQAIYSFIGADVDFMNTTRETIGARELPLSVTYRCPARVVEIARRIVPDLEVSPTAIDGTVETRPIHAADWEVGDTVLSRTNAPLVRYALSVIRGGLKARIQGRSEVGDRLRGKIKAFKTVGTVDFLRAITEQAEKKRSKIFQKGELDQADQDELEEIADSLEQFRELAEGTEITAEIEQRIDMLFTDAGEDYVVFSTVHQAKGLEWNSVFLLAWTFKPKRSQEDENIWYVAITRTKDRLVFAHDGTEKDEIVTRAMADGRG